MDYQIEPLLRERVSLNQAWDIGYRPGYINPLFAAVCRCGKG